MTRQTKKDIDDYLQGAKEDLDKLNSQYTQETLNQLDAFHVSKVFDCVNKLRTILDFIYFDIVNKVVKPSSLTTKDNKLITALGQNLHFPYNSNNANDLRRLSILNALFSLNGDLFEVIEDCQPYRDIHKTIKSICYLSNKSKHQGSHQEKKKYQIVAVGKTNSNMGRMILQELENVIIEAPANPLVVPDGVSIFNSKRVSIHNVVTPQFEVVDSTKIDISNGVCDGVRSINSCVTLTWNTIDQRPQPNAILIDGEKWSIENYSNKRNEQTISLIEETHFTIEGKDVKIIQLLNRGKAMVEDVIQRVYTILDTVT